MQRGRSENEIARIHAASALHFDREIRPPVAVEVAEDKAVLEAELTCRAAEFVAADEAEGLVAGSGRLGVDVGQIDLSCWLRLKSSITSCVALARLSAAAVKTKRSAPEPPVRRSDPRSADQHIGAAETVEVIVAGATDEFVGSA